MVDCGVERATPAYTVIAGAERGAGAESTGSSGVSAIGRSSSSTASRVGMPPDWGGDVGEIPGNFGE